MIYQNVNARAEKLLIRCTTNRVHNKRRLNMAIRLKDLKFNVVETLKGELLLIEEPRVYENYAEGIKTGPAGKAYTCIAEGLSYEKVTIKVPGFGEHQLEYEGKPTRVMFEGLEGKVWQDFSNKGEIKLTITATSIAPTIERNRLKVNVGDKA